MGPVLYLAPASPPCRAVLMTAKAIDLSLQEKVIDFQKGDHRKPEYLKLNPQHTVPTLVEDDGFAIWDSHSIMSYLVSKYGKNDSLYPKDLKSRAMVDQRLHFESSVISPRASSILLALWQKGKKSINDEDNSSAREVYEFLEAFLAENKWMVGNEITIADYSIISSVSVFHMFVPVVEEKFPKLAAWIKNVEALPEYAPSRKGAAILATLIQSKLS